VATLRAPFQLTLIQDTGCRPAVYQFISHGCITLTKWSSTCWTFRTAWTTASLTMQLTRNVGIFEHVCTQIMDIWATVLTKGRTTQIHSAIRHEMFFSHTQHNFGAMESITRILLQISYFFRQNRLRCDKVRANYKVARFMRTLCETESSESYCVASLCCHNYDISLPIVFVLLSLYVNMTLQSTCMCRRTTTVTVAARITPPTSFIIAVWLPVYTYYMTRCCR